MKILWRPGRAADLADLCRLENDSFAGDRLSRRSFQRLLKAPSARLLVARSGDGTAGYVLVLFRRGSRLGRVYSLAVGAEFRGMGLGRKLLQAAETVAGEQGCRFLQLEVREDNLPAIGLYQSLGYQLHSRRTGYYEDGGDALCWRKSIGPPGNSAGGS